MADYLIDTRRYQRHNNHQLRVGYEGQLGEFHAKGGFAFSLVGTVGSDSYQMKLPAPWNGFRYKLEQGKRMLATASKARLERGVATYDLKLPSRQLTLVSRDRLGLSWALIEGGTECGSYVQREFGKQDEWSADLRAPREWSVPLAAFVAWLVCQAPEGTIPLP